MTTNKEKYSIVKNNEVIQSASTEKLVWRLCGARNAADRKLLQNLGFTLVENVMPAEGVDLSHISAELT